jgi:hypothetical protein
MNQVDTLRSPHTASVPGILSKPKFNLFERVQWKPLPSSDFGVIVGLQYHPTEQLPNWQWRYAIWLDPQSASYGWVQVDWAWEEALERPVELFCPYSTAGE